MFGTRVTNTGRVRQRTIRPAIRPPLSVGSHAPAAGILSGLTVLLVWGVLAFGAVYSWAYTPLLTGAALLGVWALWRSEKADRAVLIPVAAVLALIAVAALTQLVPVPRGVLAWVSPMADTLLRSLDPAYVAGLEGSHPLSIDPASGWRGLAFLVSLAVFTCGIAAMLPRLDVRPVPRNLLVLGVLVALLGFAQRATFNGRIYWFWTPTFDAANAFGPFVNRNHFAGWMIMATALGGGYVCALSRQSLPRMGRGLRARLLWLSLDETNKLILAMVAVLTMSAALVATLSRSGILGFTAVVALFAFHSARRLSGPARVGVASFFLGAFVLGLAWRGFGTVANWYSRTNTFEWRLMLWHDTIPMVKDFVLAGTGLNTYGTATLLYPSSDPLWHAMETHNDYLQIAAEGGLLLGIPVLVALVVIVREIRRRFRVHHTPMRYWLRVGAVIGLVGIAVQETVEFSLQMPGNAVLFCVLLAMALHPSRPPSRHRSSSVAVAAH